MTAKPDPELRSFPTTQWSLLGRAVDGDGDPIAQQQALSQLLQRYQPALRAFAIYKHRVPWHVAEDLAQGFITQKILEHDLLGKANPARGKLRTLLMTSLDRYFYSALRARHAQKRSSHRAISLHDDGISQLAVTHDPPGRGFDTAWARHLLARAIRATRNECRQTNQPQTWGVFYHRIVRTTLGQREPLPYDRVVSKYNFRSPAQASNALVTAKRMFARNLRQLVAEYTTTQAEQETELQDLIKALSSVK